MIVGFDFGTTNSLISSISGGRPIDYLDEAEGLPHPSIVRYEGEEVIVGREAKRSLTNAKIGVHGNTVRSPKFMLGHRTAEVAGVERRPIDIVADVIKYVKKETLASPRARNLGDIDRAVVTIPVDMNGPRRGELRQAFAQADISVVQFVHEPLAALYGYLRGHQDSASEIRRLAQRYVLVVDWGGGTLDLTLCRIERGRIVQIRNGGTDKLGGDWFDAAIMEEVVTRFRNREGLDENDVPTPDARRRLLHDTERTKVALSDREYATLYCPGFFGGSGTSLEYRLDRTEFDEITSTLVLNGVNKIRALLASAGVAEAQVAMCLVVGGMAAMPSIRSHLHELFGAERVHITRDSGTLVARGAAWIAEDAQPLVLAKDIELELARGARLPLLHAGTAMPNRTEIRRESFHLYCSDPTDGTAKFPIVAPTDVSEAPQVSDPRTNIGMVTIEVDRTARPLFERLELTATIDDDLILTVGARSAQRCDHDEMAFFDLEFGIGLPGSEDLGPADLASFGAAPLPQGLVLRANVAADQDKATVPGDVLYEHDSTAFLRGPGVGRATAVQTDERLYYQPCSVCGRTWGDPDCRCASGG